MSSEQSKQKQHRFLEFLPAAARWSENHFFTKVEINFGRAVGRLRKYDERESGPVP